MLIRSIRPQNILSFGPDTPPIELRPLNVLVGANGSGKSNFLEVINVLKSLPTGLARGFTPGPFRDWVWNRTQDSGIRLRAAFEMPGLPWPLVYGLEIGEISERPRVFAEYVLADLEEGSDCMASPFHEPYSKIETGRRDGLIPYFSRSDKGGRFFPEGGRPEFAGAVDSAESVLQQHRDREQFRDMFWLGECLSDAFSFNSWTFGRKSQPRLYQPGDQIHDFLSETSENLGLVLQDIRLAPAARRRVEEALRSLYESADGFEVSMKAGALQIAIAEGDRMVPATRLSDGTLRYLALLAILCHPSPPPLVCIEEPELGLHPDVLPEIARLLREASERTQLIVTTHSPTLIDAFSEYPECVVVCEKRDGATQMRRLEEEKLREWLDEYGLGHLWRRGDIGGNRW